MRLTSRTDLGLRLLMLCAERSPEEVSISKAAQVLGVSKEHLMKAGQDLRQLGFLDAVHGRSGGFKLAKAPVDINLRSVVVGLETDLTMVECMRPDESNCTLTKGCRLPAILSQATESFLAHLGRFTLDSLIQDNPGLTHALAEETDGPRTPTPAEIARKQASQLRDEFRQRAVGKGITREFISDLVDQFYTKVRDDKELGPVFDDVIMNNWPAHLQKMKHFWASIMLHTGEYKGNPMQQHIALDAAERIHFSIWLRLFEQTLCELNATDEAKEMFMGTANSIAARFQQVMFG